MMRGATTLIVLSALMLMEAVPVQTESSAVESIRATRERSNRALAARDLETLRATWVADINVVTSSGTVRSGNAAVVAAFEQAFDDPTFVTYVRTPDRVQVGALDSEAAESGTWLGTWNKPDGEMRLSGTYLAQWRRVEAAWRIRAEVFVALECSGSSECARR